MENLVLETPIKLRIPKNLVKDLKGKLEYSDEKSRFEYNRLRNVKKQISRTGVDWYTSKYGEGQLDLDIEKAKESVNKSMLFEDEKGYWTYSGIANKLGLQTELGYPKPKITNCLEWVNKHPTFRQFQVEAVDYLLSRCFFGPVAVELATGLGKSLIIAMLVQNMALKTVIVVPTISIGYQMFEMLSNYFGENLVGQYFDLKKDYEKLITVIVAKSLHAMEEGSKVFDSIATSSVLICDESHLLPAETLSKVILGWMGNIPYRFFLSGTQIRNDGLELLLDGIVGNVVMRRDLRWGVENSYLSPIQFAQFSIKSELDLQSKDSLKMNRVHLQENKAVYKHSANFVKWGIDNGRKALILLSEVDQIPLVLKETFKYTNKVGICIGGTLTKKQKDSIPSQFHKLDPNDQVKRFDNNEFPILVGTQCIGVGTDIKSVSLISDLVGLTSEIRLRQNAGRGSRLFPGKTDCLYSDYNIYNIPCLKAHAEIRAKIMDEIYGPVRFV